MAEPVPHTEPIDKNVVDRAIEAISKVLSYSFALSIVVTIYDVVSDVVFKSPTVWVYDVVTTAIAVAFLIGGSYALMRREHIRITALYQRFSRRTRLRCDVVTSLLAIVYLAAFAWFAFDMASHLHRGLGGRRFRLGAADADRRQGRDGARRRCS